MNLALAGLVLLVIGDSHMVSQGYLISSLHDQLVSQGASVHSYGACGTNAGDWVYGGTASCGVAERHERAPPQIDYKPRVKSWTVKELIDRHQPNLIVVQMGDTMAAYGQAALPQAWIYGQVRALTGAIRTHKVSCVWVGPPWGSGGSYGKTAARVREMSRYLERIVAPCSYLDSTAFARETEWPTIDGQHLSANGYRAWGKSIADAVARVAGARQTQAGEGGKTFLPERR